VARAISPPKASISRTTCPFPTPPDGRVAGHLANLGFVEGNQKGGKAQPGPRQSGLNGGVTRTDDDKICHREIGPSIVAGEVHEAR
jgi:hypothetical protein